jgi:hypothetical protein
VTAAGAALSVVVLTAIPPVAPSRDAVPPTSTGRPVLLPTQASDPLFTFVSIPDFLNYDVATLRSLPRWTPALGDGTNARWKRAIRHVLDSVAAERPNAVLVAGDLVEGHWGSDVDGSGLFGRTGTSAQRLAAVRRAGRFYYAAWQRRFDRRHLTVYPAPGDHDIGDNPWPPGSFSLRAVPEHRRAFAAAFTRTESGRPRFTMRPVGTEHAGTAYAVRLPGVLLVSLDVFERISDGVVPRVSGGQLRWLRRVLGRARHDGVPHIVVQGHTPVLGPVPSDHSSDLMLQGGAHSALWELLERNHVELYLCGEVHAMSTRTAGGVVQIAHGGLIAHGSTSYLLGRVYQDHIDLELKVFPGHAQWARGRHLWATTEKRPAGRVWLPAEPRLAGVARLVRRGERARLVRASGLLGR